MKTMMELPRDGHKCLYHSLVPVDILYKAGSGFEHALHHVDDGEKSYTTKFRFPVRFFVCLSDQRLSLIQREDRAS